jgi:hypothetical protein
MALVGTYFQSLKAIRRYFCGTLASDPPNTSNTKPYYLG